jgi:allantoicase
MTDAAGLVDLAAARLGGAVLAANDEFFAPKESLVVEAEPVFIPDKYTDRGKWMDGWETRRRRTPGHDWALLRLGLPGVVRQVVVDTAHFKGNYPESCSLEGCAAPPEEPVERLLDGTYAWHGVVPRSPLQGDSRNAFAAAAPWRFTHLRLNIHPDGGVARLRVLGEVVADWRGVAGAVDLAALARGARVVGCSDRFFGAPEKMLLPGPALGMHDGWETRRRRGPGHDWAIVRLAAEGEVERVEVDTAHFKGNAPGGCALEGCASAADVPPPDAAWRTLLPETTLRPDALQVFAEELRREGPVTHVRLAIYPDGGVARLRVVGTPTARGRRAAALRWLDTLPPEKAEAELRACGGCAAWAHALAARRPFGSWEGLVAAAEEVWDGVGREDWIEALNSHPRLGESADPGPAAGSGERPVGTTHHSHPERSEGSGRGSGQQAPGGADPESTWSAQEQSGTATADRETLARLAEANRTYAERFGWTFVVCATGRSAGEMLAAYERRIGNDPEAELAVAAAEQRTISRIRLGKLLGAADGGR